jgi:hypothetical protein
MGKEIQIIRDESKDVVFDEKNGCVRYQGLKLHRDSLRAFFGLSKLGKMVRFGLDAKGKTTVVQMVSEGIENLFTEMERLITKYSDNPEKGFREIEKVIKFARQISNIEKP